MIAFAAAVGCVMLFCVSCYPNVGWHLNAGLPEKIIMDKIGIRKVYLSSVESGNLTTSKFPIIRSQPLSRNISVAVFGTEPEVWHYEKITFDNIVYHVGWDHIDRQIIFVKDDFLGKIVKKLHLPRKMNSFVIFDIQFESKKYLVVSVQNRMRTDSSLLFILDEELNTVYEEHAPYAFEIGKYKDERHGECVIVKYGPSYVEERAKYYMYYLSGKDRPVDEPVR